MTANSYCKTVFTTRQYGGGGAQKNRELLKTPLTSDSWKRVRKSTKKSIFKTKKIINVFSLRKHRADTFSSHEEALCQRYWKIQINWDTSIKIKKNACI